MIFCRCDMCKKEIPDDVESYKVSLMEGKLDTIYIDTRKYFDMCERCTKILFEGLIGE